MRANNVSKQFKGAKFVTKDKAVGATGAVQMKGVGTMAPSRKMTPEGKAKMARTKLKNAAERTMFSSRSK